jgi:drug/metabolite transporter (DMT)-like permease
MWKWVALAFGLVGSALVITYQILGDAGAARPAQLTVAYTGAGLAAAGAVLWVVHKLAAQRDNSKPPDDSRPTP